MAWNVTGIMSSAAYLCSSLNQRKIDIVGISEHWLYPHNAYFLTDIMSNYRAHVVGDKDLYLSSSRKVGKGGVALMWHRRLDQYIVPLSFIGI